MNNAGRDAIDPLSVLVADAGRDGEVAPLKEARRSFERRYILAVLQRCDWSIAAAAQALGLQRPNLYRKARQLSIPVKPPAAD